MTQIALVAAALLIGLPAPVSSPPPQLPPAPVTSPLPAPPLGTVTGSLPPVLGSPPSASTLPAGGSATGTAAAAPRGSSSAPAAESRPPAAAQAGESGPGADAPAAGGAQTTAARMALSLLDTPLGPTPPLLGLLLIAISVALAVQRRLRQRARDRALEEAKMHFLKVASHELRTPLTVIGGYVSMAADGSLGSLPAPMRRALPTLHEEIDQLERLVEQMLLATRLDEGLLKLEHGRIDLREVAMAGLQAVPPSERRRLVVDMPPEPVPVLGDAAALQLVVRNLIENALKYSPEDREVRLSVAGGWRRAQISVSDRGIGIGRGDLRVLFTRFGRIVNAENSHVFGSGLGLYLARGIARLHDGDVSAESEEGRGSTFTLELPPAAPLLRRWRVSSAPSPESPAPRAGVP